MLKKFTIIAPAMALALTASAAFAEDDRAGKRKMKKEITQSEFMERKAELFKKLDKDGNGSLSAAERKAGHKMKKEHRKEKMEARKAKREERKEKREERKTSRGTE